MQNIPVARLQFRLTLAFALTVFKAQGQTFSKLIVDLTKPENGLLPINFAYTAIGRATNSNFILRPFKQSCIQSKPCQSLLNELK
jgi:ATP-dependent exoDNAse (exonuclease V) alpha subunit